jgi:hypothetical protein
MVAWLRCAHLKTLAVHHIGIPESENSHTADVDTPGESFAMMR